MFLCGGCYMFFLIFFFFFNDTATTEIYTLSLHDALPIPVVNCEECGPVPVPVEDLPVVLPRDVEPTGEGNPLAERPDFVDVECPRCGKPAKRETDTLDCHFDALWLWVPAAVPPEGRAEQMFTHGDLSRWLPPERLVAGNDS